MAVKNVPRIIYGLTAERPTAQNIKGTVFVCTDTLKIYFAIGAQWVLIGLPATAFSGLSKITVNATQPTNPQVGDLWIQTT